MRQDKGYTLVELLVVIAILSLSISLVAPGFFKAFENVRSKVELKEFRGDLESMFQQAFYQETNLRILLQGRRMVVSDPEQRELFNKEYEYLGFRRADIGINQFGFIEPIEIAVVIDDEETRIRLP